MMRTFMRFLLLLALAFAFCGCANSPYDSGAGYYRRGSIHTDSFPSDYHYQRGPGYYRYGRPGMY